MSRHRTPTPNALRLLARRPPPLPCFGLYGGGGWRPRGGGQSPPRSTATGRHPPRAMVARGHLPFDAVPPLAFHRTSGRVQPPPCNTSAKHSTFAKPMKGAPYLAPATPHHQLHAATAGAPTADGPTNPQRASQSLVHSVSTGDADGPSQTSVRAKATGHTSVPIVILVATVICQILARRQGHRGGTSTIEPYSFR